MCTAMKMPSEEIFEHKEDITIAGKEVMTHLYQAVIALPEFTLKDGRRAKTESLAEPQMNDEGELYLSFDVALDDGSHMEFTTKNTGWGGFVAAQTSRKAGRRSR
jgi:hypothetical protein